MAFKVEPEYSEAARKVKLQGVVVLGIVVDSTGHPVNIAVLKSLGKGLDEKAIEAVLQWRFMPGFLHGHSVNVAATIEVKYSVTLSELTK
jgi:periplasmic protein TonB